MNNRKSDHRHPSNEGMAALVTFLGLGAWGLLMAYCLFMWVTQ